MKYTRPEINALKENFKSLTNSFANAGSFEEAVKVLGEINKTRNEFESMRVITVINYTIDTSNKAFSDEQDYFDNNSPLFAECVNNFYKELLRSKFKDQLEKKFGRQLFSVAEFTMNSFDHKIVEDLQKENHMCSEYTELKASAKIMFEGKERNLQELDPFLESPDREIRKKAFDAYWNFISGKSEEFDTLYDKLVSLRNDMALKLGYKNFVELGYVRMKRADYDYKMVEEFRKNIRKYFVPLALKLREKQKKRIAVDKLMAYDILLQFKSGNAIPKGDPEWIINNGKKMYDELSPQTSEFYDYMMNNDLMDVYSRQGKADMGYCDFIPGYKSPFIFANMNGTNGDITVLTHEAGHAFQSYCNRNFEIPEYFYPTMESCEIHSMSMEFLTYPWMNLFFKEDNDKFKFTHLNGAVYLLPHGVLIDEFQHRIYENPSATPQERKSIWRELEKIYMPYLNYGENEFLESGGKWQKIPHIYEMPFYYIDYCLAQICALQVWSKAIHSGNGQYKSVLEDYIRLCEAGGSRSFLELVKIANLESPFEEGVIKKLANEIEEYIDSVDDAAL